MLPIISLIIKLFGVSLFTPIPGDEVTLGGILAVALTVSLALHIFKELSGRS